MRSKDLRSENDNLAEWREKKKDLTRALVERSIQKLVEMHAKITAKNVCEIMAQIATEEEKQYKAVITPSAISKNEEIKALIQAAQAKYNNTNNTTNETYKTDGDQQYEIFRLKSIIAKQESKIKEFQSIIKRADIKDTSTYKVSTPDDHYKHILIDIIKLSTADGFLYLEPGTGHLLNEGTGEIVVDKSVLQALGITGIPK